MLGVAPQDSGLCVATAAVSGGEIVSLRIGSLTAPLSHAASTRDSTYCQDIIHAQTLQQEENDLAVQADASVASDAELAAYMADPLVVKHEPLPADPFTPPAPR